MANLESRRAEVFEPHFAVSSASKNGYPRVVVSGELDLATVPLLEQEIERAQRRGSGAVAVDLHGLSFMDVAGLRCLLSAAERVEAEGGALALIGAGQAVRRVFELTGNGGHLDGDTFPHAVHANGNGHG